MKIIKNRLRTIFMLIIKFVSLFIPKRKTTIFCFPEHITCISNHVDIINYTADNTLSFINYLLRNYKGAKLTVYLFYYERNRHNDYVKYVSSLDNKNMHIIFVFFEKNKLQSNLKRIVYLIKSKYIFTSNFDEERFAYKLKSQIYIALNYYTTSFKTWHKHSYKWQSDYVITTSLLSSQIQSAYTQAPLEKFQSLGLSRNDNIVTPRFSRDQLMDLLNLSINPDKMIVHTPTHRMRNKFSTKKDAINYKDSLEELNSILNKHNAFLIVAPHPSERLTINTDKNDRIVLYEPNYQYTLYDIFAHTDIFITDYTSAYFDFLLRDRPVIFNFFDIDLYEKDRGFVFDPVENICAGPIVKNIDELFNAIEHALAGVDEYKEHRKFVTSMIYKHVDSDTSKRIFDFFESVINQ